MKTSRVHYGAFTGGPMNFKNRFLLTAVFFSGSAPWDLAHAGTPRPRESFYYAINGDQGDKNSSKNFFIDLFDTADDPARVKRLKNQNKNVICYFSAGTSEANRPDLEKLGNSKNKTGKKGIKDYPSAIGKKLAEWPENWLDYREPGIVTIMKARIDLAKKLGCDAVDPDNVDGHLNSTGFPLTSRDQKSYLSALSSYARSLGLKIGLKNSAETASSIQPLFDFVVVEECARYKECPAYKSFAENGKAIFQLEYVTKGKANDNTKCKDAAANGRTLVFANYDLTWLSACSK